MSDQEDFSLNPDAVEVAAQLETYTIAKLRQFAGLYRVSFAKDSNKEEIIAAIRNKMKNTSLVKIVSEDDGSPQPGFVRIKLMRETQQGARNAPVYVQVNGRTAALPRGVPCDIPKKFVEALRNSTHPQIIVDSSRAFNDPKRTKVEHSPSYPFEVLESTAGPDPWPGSEISRKASYGPREKFWKKFGRWPRRGEVHEAIKGGFITLGSDEYLSESELKSNSKK